MNPPDIEDIEPNGERKIDMDYLVFAWQDECPDHIYYFNINTGNVQLVQRDLLDLRDLTDEIEIHKEQYLYLPKPEAKDIQKDIRDFIDTISDTHLKNVATIAFESPDITAAFNKILSAKELELKRWQEFKRLKVQERIEKWLKANFVTLI